MSAPRTITCEHCGGSFEARRRSARFCSARCQKAAARRRGPLTPALTVTRAQVLAELDAMAELLPLDAAVLEARFPIGEDPEMDELSGALWTYLAGVELVRNYLTTRKETS